ncbi:YdcF family protein [Novosphingobium sp. Gsoil 351]|uniref:YdcF family protein n=1 Tax=Novosphingobium sp. Gsoil 351 TaxID=2675225 RepID=UPI0012B49BBF|nr:YdcF family protein [Novosphingobium sp. Gsoil 351]QGN55056.1 YdcF family protein [Novosphingobium sp. Gsoil 351]
MLRRLASFLVIAWALGFVWFAAIPPQPIGAGRSDAAIVLTGGDGRIQRALAVLGKGWVDKILVAGVDSEVRPREFAAEYEVSARTMARCVALDQVSVDTRTNAREAALWIAANKVRSVRLITSDWHMRRAAWELAKAAPDVEIARDAVRTKPSFRILFIEYHKLIARRIAHVLGY